MSYRESIRSVVSARNHVLANSGIDLAQTFGQNDIHRSGFLPRHMFAAIIRDCGVPISDVELHFLMMYLAKSGDNHSVSYVRFLEFMGFDRGYGGHVQQPVTYARPIAAPAWTDSRYLIQCMAYEKCVFLCVLQTIQAVAGLE